MSEAAISKVPETTGCGLQWHFQMLPYQEHPLDLGLFKRYFCYFFYFKNYENLHASSDNQRLNSARLKPISYVQLLCRVSHYYSGGTTTIWTAYSLSPTPTHLHGFQIFIFQNASCSQSLQKATNIPESAQMKHCTQLFTVESLKKRVWTTEVVQEQTLQT